MIRSLVCFYWIELLVLSTKAGPDGKKLVVLTKENIDLVRWNNLEEELTQSILLSRSPLAL
jgi:hypothetical protein